LVILARSLLMIAVFFIMLTWWALESGGVAILESQTSDDTVRSTHVWYAEANGALWVEAGTPQNAWFLDVQADPEIFLYTSEGSGEYIAEIIPGDAAHQRIRSLLREKYGFRDWWIGAIFDTSQSIAVRMAPPPVAEPR